MIPGMPSVASALLARQPEQGQQPFTWGQGGARLSPEQLALQSRMAQSNIAAGMDTSPVGHWTQGLARVAQALVGNMQQGRLDKQYAAQMAESEAASSAALNALGGGDTRSLAAILSNPLVNDGVKDVAKMQLQAANKAPAAPHYWETNNGSLGIVDPLTGQPRILYEDPTPKINYITADNPDGTKNIIPVGPNGPMLKGGDPSASVPMKPVGKLTPITGGAPSQGGASFR